MTRLNMGFPRCSPGGRTPVTKMQVNPFGDKSFEMIDDVWAVVWFASNRLLYIVCCMWCTSGKAFLCTVTGVRVCDKSRCGAASAPGAAAAQ